MKQSTPKRQFDHSREWKPLGATFFMRPTLVVARDLLGRYLVRRIGHKVMAGRIVEVEAYRGPDDPASHAYRGRTPRNEVMFWKGGHLYVYFTYGMHFCANVVTGDEGIPGAVLLRAVEPVKGIAVLRDNRPRARDDRDLTNGPAKLCEAFRLSRKQNGLALSGPEVELTFGRPLPPHRRASSARLGIRNGQAKRWRFFERANAWVSRGPSR